MLSYRCLGKQQAWNNNYPLQYLFFLEKFIPQFLCFNFLLSVYLIHSLPSTVHIGTHTKHFLIVLSSCPSRFMVPCWGAEQGIQDSDLRGSVQDLALPLTSWVTWPKLLCWKKQVKWCFYIVLIYTKPCINILLVLLLPTLSWVRDCTSDGSHGTKSSSAAFGTMVKKEP